MLLSLWTPFLVYFLLKVVGKEQEGQCSFRKLNDSEAHVQGVTELTNLKHLYMAAGISAFLCSYPHKEP